MSRRLSPLTSRKDWAAAAPSPTKITGTPVRRLKFSRQVAEATPTSRVRVFTHTIDQVAEGREARSDSPRSGRRVRRSIRKEYRGPGSQGGGRARNKRASDVGSAAPVCEHG